MPVQREITVEDYVWILRRRWLLIVALAVVGSILGYAAAKVLAKKFTSQTLVLVTQPTVSADIVKPVVDEDINQRLSAMQQQILSNSSLQPIIAKFGLYHDKAAKLPMEDQVALLRKAVEVTPIQPMAQTRSQGLPGFTVSVTFDNPILAQQICSTITSMFTQQSLEFRQQRAEKTTQFLGSQLDDAKAKLDDQDAKLAAFKRRYLGSLPDEEQANLNLLMNLTSQLDATTQALDRAQQDKTFNESLLAQQLATSQSVGEGPSPDMLGQQLAAMQTQLRMLKSKYTDNYPDVIKVRSDINALKQKIADAEPDQKIASADNTSAKPAGESPQIQALRTQIHQYDEMIKEKTVQQEQIQQQIKDYQTRVQSSPAIEQEYKELTRDYQTALDFYNDLMKRRDQSEMATNLERNQQGEQFQVLDPANLPNSPSFPKKSIFTAGGFAGGLALGVGITLLLEMQDTSLRREKDVESLLHLHVLAMVPAIKPLSPSSGKNGSLSVAMRT